MVTSLACVGDVTDSTTAPDEVNKLAQSVSGFAIVSNAAAATSDAVGAKKSFVSTFTDAPVKCTAISSASGKIRLRSARKAARSNVSTLPARVKIVVTTSVYLAPGGVGGAPGNGGDGSGSGGDGGGGDGDATMHDPSSTVA